MFAYEATFEVDGSDKEVILVGAPNLAAAARKAKEEEKKGKERSDLARRRLERHSVVREVLQEISKGELICAVPSQ